MALTKIGRAGINTSAGVLNTIYLEYDDTRLPDGGNIMLDMTANAMPTYSTTVLLRMLNNGLNVVGGSLQFGNTQYNLKTEKTWGSLDTITSNNPYISQFSNDVRAQGIWYGYNANSSSSIYTYFHIIVVYVPNRSWCALYAAASHQTTQNAGETWDKSIDASYSSCRQLISNYIDAINDGVVILDYEGEPTDPYDGAGDSGTGGGDGTFDGSSDPVDIPPLPTVGAADAGFITLFAPTTGQLKALASYMWSSLFDIEGGGTGLAFKKLFNDPMDCILGMSVVPVSVPTSGAREITIGNLVTTVSMNVASQQYIEVDCGSVDFSKRYFGSYLDFEPYTKMAIFLPYCGVHQISADDVMGKNIRVVYHIDILTGSCIAFVKCGDSVLYEFNGACASNIPVNSINYASTIENAIRIAVNIGTTVATAGAAAPMSAGEGIIANAQNIGRGISLAGSTAEGALSMKPSISRSGALGGGVGLLGNQIPYIIITRPKLCKPKNQDFFQGYPSFIQTTVGDLAGSGFTSFESVIVAAQYLTEGECAELESILRGGVYL